MREDVKYKEELEDYVTNPFFKGTFEQFYASENPFEVSEEEYEKLELQRIMEWSYR